MIPKLAILPALVAAGPGVCGPDWSDAGAIFKLRCVMCHSDLGAARGLRLDSYAAAMKGSEHGAVLLAGDVEHSELMRRVRGESTPRMPFLGPPLPEAEIEVIRQWIAAGLPETGP